MMKTQTNYPTRRSFSIYSKLVILCMLQLHRQVNKILIQNLLAHQSIKHSKSYFLYCSRNSWSKVKRPKSDCKQGSCLYTEGDIDRTLRQITTSQKPCIHPKAMSPSSMPFWAICNLKSLVDPRTVLFKSTLGVIAYDSTEILNHIMCLASLSDLLKTCIFLGLFGNCPESIRCVCIIFQRFQFESHSLYQCTAESKVQQGSKDSNPPQMFLKTCMLKAYFRYLTGFLAWFEKLLNGDWAG